MASFKTPNIFPDFFSLLMSLGGIIVEIGSESPVKHISIYIFRPEKMMAKDLVYAIAFMNAIHLLQNVSRNSS